jgi:acetyltransferase-like isoleucine patch superfamily enzyme
MNLSRFNPKNIFYLIKIILFYLLNFYKYKRLEFRSFIFKPLRIQGKKYIEIHKNVGIQKLSWLATFKLDENDPELIFGEGCAIGDFNHISAVRKVVFGKNVLTANRVYVSDNLHGFEDINIPIMHQKVRFKAEVKIGDGTWLGENVCVIGANIGKNCVIGANSVVTKNIPDYSIAVGMPAKIIKRYNLKTNKWEKTDSEGNFLIS